VSEFRRVGPEVAPGELYVDLADVQPLHDIVVDELLLMARAPKIVWNETSDDVQFAHYFTSLDEKEDDFVNRFVSARVRHESGPDGWRLSVHHRTFTPTKRHSNKRVSHHFEIVEGRLVEARKATFFVQGNSQVIFGKDGEPLEVVTTERKMHERAVKPEDCSELLEFLGRSARWARIAKK
jgi:hypothetical protein